MRMCSAIAGGSPSLYSDRVLYAGLARQLLLGSVDRFHVTGLLQEVGPSKHTDGAPRPRPGTETTTPRWPGREPPAWRRPATTAGQLRYDGTTRGPGRLACWCTTRATLTPVASVARTTPSSSAIQSRTAGRRAFRVREAGLGFARTHPAKFGLSATSTSSTLVGSLQLSPKTRTTLRRAAVAWDLPLAITSEHREWRRRTTARRGSTPRRAPPGRSRWPASPG